MFRYFSIELFIFKEKNINTLHFFCCFSIGKDDEINYTAKNFVTSHLKILLTNF